MKRNSILSILLFLNVILLGFIIWGNWRISQVSFFAPKKPLTESVLSEQASKSQPEFPALSLESVFSTEQKNAATFSGSEMVTLISSGDVMLGRSINAQSVKLADFDWAWEKTSEILNGADITFINLESPFGFDCPITNEGMKFCADARQADGLISAGVDIVNLANNHVNDQGFQAAKETESLLKTGSFLTTGLTEPAYKNVRGVLFAFLGYCDVCWGQFKAEDEKILMEIEGAQQNADVVVVSFHWGEEYAQMPTLRQKELAHLAIDAGADLVIGHHPHWIQPIEVYKEKLIAYSLGNFIFDQNWSQETKEGMALRCFFQNGKLIGVEPLPVLMNNSGQPEFAIGEEKERILNELKEASFQLAKA